MFEGTKFAIQMIITAIVLTYVNSILGIIPGFVAANQDGLFPPLIGAFFYALFFVGVGLLLGLRVIKSHNKFLIKNGKTPLTREFESMIGIGFGYIYVIILDLIYIVWNIKTHI